MKNFLFNLIKSTAKATQNAGGGASRKLMRHEDARSLAQSDNRYCIGNASDLSPRLVRLDSVSILSRQSDLRTYVGRIAAILVLVLTVGIGKMWGADFTITLADITPESNWYEVAGVGRVTNKTGGAFSAPDYASSTNCSKQGYKTGSSNFTIQTYLAVSAIKIWAASSSNRDINYVTVQSTATVASSSNTVEYTAPKNGSYHFNKESCDQEVTITFSSEVAANKYINVSLSGNTDIIAVTLVPASCDEDPDEPTGFTVGSITGTGATFSITDAANTNNYEIYYSTSSTAPTSGTSATTTSTSKTKAVTDLTAGTTYYAWVRAKCDASHKSDWVALSGGSFATKAQYTITYNKGVNGTGSISAGSKTEGEDFTLSSSVFTRDGYAQTGWATSDGGSKAYDMGGTYSADAAITLYPVWTATTTYTFDYSNSKSISTLEGEGWTFNSASTTSMTDVGTFVNLVKTFNDNSVTTPTGKGMYDYSIAFAKNTSAYARYEFEDAATVTSVTGTIHVGTTGSFDITIKYLASDKSTVLRTYTLAHNKSDWGSNSINDETAVANVKCIQIEGASKWQVMDELNITYAATPSCTAPTSPNITGTTTYTAGGTISLTASATGTTGSSTYTWYKGADWATASANSSIGSTATFSKASCVVGDAGTYWCNISNGTGCDVQVSKTITVGYSVTYNGSSADDGTVPVDGSSPYTSGSTVTVLGNTGSLERAIKEDDATFEGWNTNSNMYGGTHYNAGETFSISGNTTLYAVWGYSITWNKNGGEWVEYTAPSYYIYGQGLASLPSSAKISKSGYELDHWELDYDNSTVTSIDDGATGSVQLNAIWTEAGSDYTLTWDFNGGGCTETAGDDYTAGGDVTSGTTLAYPSNSSMSKPGYKFNGWSSSPSTMPESDLTLTAQWVAFDLRTVSGLDVDAGATLSSIPLSWSIPGICDLKGWTDPLVIPNNGRNEYGVLDKSNSSYSEVGDYVTANGNTPIWGQFGVGFNIPETSSLSWLSYEWKGTFYDATNGNDVILCGVSCDDTYAYWKLNGYKTLNDDSQWNESGQQVPDQIYWGEGAYPSPAPEVSQIVIYANAGHDAYDEVTFSVRNVRYGIDDDKEDIDHIVLMRKEGSEATGIADPIATKLYEGTKSHYTDASDVTGKNYYYTVFAVHANGAVSTGVSTSLTLYTITYSAGENGSGTVAADKKTHGINFTLSSSTFTRGGFTQDGWSTSDGGAKVYELGGTYSADEAIILYPHWVADAAEDITNGNPSNGTISITDGVSSLSKASAGATVTITATPATGYNFSSWDVYKTGESSTKVSTAAATASTTFTMPSYAVTVDASFSAKTYTVTLNGNGGSGNTANVTATYGSSSFSSSITNPTKTGYIFGGWYSGTGGTGTLIISSVGVLQSSTTYSDGSGNWTNDGNVTLYAKWITILPATLNKSNMTAVSGNMTYYETNYFDYGDGHTGSNTDRWVEWDVYLVPCTYSVSTTGYYPNGHQWRISIKDTEEVYELPATYGSTATETGASGWDLTGLSEGVYTVRVMNIMDWGQPKLLSLTLGATVYTVTYDANGGTCSTASKTVCSGGEVTLPSALGDGAFEGWYTSSDEEIGGAGDSYEPTADITLYAHWGASCPTPAAPTDFDLSSSTMTTATFAITDGGDAASYDLYYASGSPSTPTGETTATENVTTKTPTITGLTASTEYKIWVRSVCDASHKSVWVALDAEGGAFSTPDPETYIITYNKDGATEDQIDDGEKTEGVNFTLSSSRYTKAGYWHVGWTTSQGGSKVYDFGGTYSTDADLELYPAWIKTAVYEKSLCVTSLSELTAANTGRWTLTTGDTKVDLPSEFGGDVEENLTGDKCGLAYAENSNACAKYDIGAQGKFFQMTITMISETNNGGCCIQLLKANGTFAVDQAHSELSFNWPGSGDGWQKKTVTFTFPAGQDNVQKIYIFGSGSRTLCLQSVRFEYEPSKTYVVLDNQSATSAGTANVTATYGASTNLTSDITAPTKTNYIFGGYYTEESGAGTQLIDENGAWLASKTDYTDGSKNWQYANPDLTLYAKWTAKTTPTKYNLTGSVLGLCDEATATITLEDSEDGVTYELYKDGVATGTTKTGTGEALNWSGITAAGEYTIWTVEDETYASVQMDNDGYTQVTVVVKDDAELAYDDEEVEKTYGDAAFTNELTNNHSVSVTYESSDEDVATVDTDGEVTILHAGSTTITASFAGDATYCAASVSYELTVAKADLSVSPSAGTASSVTHYSATLPFTLGSTSGVASVTLKVYKNSDNSLVNTIEGVTAATSGSGNVTGLDAETTYYYTVTPIGDADHNDGAESSKSATFTTSAATLSALVAGTLYEVPDMIPGGESLTSDDQFFEGLSANTKFELIGSGSSSTTPKVNNKSSNDRTIAGITFDDGSMWFRGNATVSENIPSTFGLSFIVPSAGKLYLYFDDDDTSTNIKLAKSGTSGSKPTVSSGYSVVDVTSGTYYMYGTSTSSPYSFYGLKFVPTYDITLHDNNGGDNNGSADVAVNGTTLLDIDAPTRSGYIVTGYYAESDYTTLVADAEGNLEANVTVSAVDWTDGDGKWIKGSGATLYAKWVVVYTVAFNTNGGSSVDAITQTSEGGSITMPVAPTKDGYTFQGWYIGSTSYAASASYTPTANVTAYASWKAECGVIKWDFTDRSGASMTNGTSYSYTAEDGETEMRYSAGSSDAMIAYDSEKSIDGYLKENGNTGGGTVYDIDGKTNVGKTRLIRLFVEPGSGTLRINCNGAQNGVYKVLDGSASGTTLISSLSANTTSSSITLTTSPLWIETTTKGYINDIRWTPSSTVCYYVTYNGNGADGGYVNDPEAHSPGDNVTTLANSFTRTGCTFTGWNTAADGSGTAYVAGGTISSISSNVTLYAQWKITVSENKNLSEYTSDALSTTDVVVTNGATLTVTEDTEVRNITVETGSTLNVNTTNGDGTGSGVMLTVHSLSLKGGWNSSYTTYDMPRIYIDPLSTLTKSVSTVNFDISVDHYNYYPFAVPFRVKVSDINYADPTLAYYAQYGATGQYVIKEYDGERRAEKGPDHENNWKVVPQKDPETNADIYLEPGRGYIMTAVSLPAYGGGIIRIPLSFTNAWTALGEQGTVSAVTKNIVPVTAYTGKATEGDKFANKGWNLLGVPFMSCYTTSDDMGTSVVMQGKFNFETGEWDGEDKVRYVNVPVHDFSEYIQVDMEDEKTPTVLRPGWCFFVQIGTTGNLTFLTADQAASSSLPIYAPKREKANMPTVKTGIILSDGEKSDQTTFLVSDKYSAMDYEINADLEKLFGNGYTLATYSLSGETRLAYNALSNADAANIIPIGYRAPAEGEYTFSINPSYAENGAFESVNLIDYETGIVTDLSQSSYTFSTERTQDDARFALNVVKAPQTATDITVTGDGLQVTGPQKVIINDKLYIIVDGRMYDAKGVMVK